MITKNDIKTKAHEIFGMMKSIEKGLAGEKTLYYVYFECGKLHQMAIEYAENDHNGLSAKGMETLKDFDTFDDVKAYVVAIQVLIFKMLNWTEYTYEELIEAIETSKIQYVVYK